MPRKKKIEDSVKIQATSPQVEESEDRNLLEKIGTWKKKSENARSMYDNRWAKNLRLVKGIWPEDEITRSKVRNRSKLFFRKIWATNWRLLASFYNAFLRDPDSFKIEGRNAEDVQSSKVLHEMVIYRRDLMMRRQSLFIKFLWCFLDILNFGWGVGKFRWVYDGRRDEPEFIAYPPEQVFCDFTADSPEKMKYIIFEDYLNKDELESMGYENLDKAEIGSIPSNPLRATRHSQMGDPVQIARSSEYPSPGKYVGQKDENVDSKYTIWEVFYRDGDKIKFCVTNGINVFLRKPMDNPYGDFIPAVMGTCLTEPHNLIGEGFPESLEGPQESFNANLNMRKDNVALALNRGTIVSRYGGVDLQSLINSRPGGITLADDINAVKEREMNDVTRSSYSEAMVDDAMIQEMSGVTPGKQGMGSEQKATVAQINYAESNAKIDLFIAIVGETFVKNFFYILAQMIQRFETDEKILRVANANFRAKSKAPMAPEVGNFDFDFDCIVNIGAGTVGRQFDIQQNLLAMDRGITANQAAMGLLQLGMPVKLINIPKFMEMLLPKLGYKDVNEFFLEVAPPPAPPGGNGGAAVGSQALMGQIAPQIGNGAIPNMENDLQRGSGGGF